MGFQKGISLKENVIVWLEFKLVGILNGKSILIKEQQFLLWKDTTLSLFVDEIHLKPYFNYKGGNIIGLSDNSNEAATNAFDFMLRCVMWVSNNKNLCQFAVFNFNTTITLIGLYTPII